MSAPSNEVLDNKINNMVEQNNKEHWEIKAILNSINQKIDGLDRRYPTRAEFKAVSFAIGALATLIWVISFFINK